ncbi:MAG: hypothetical protein AAB875_00255 [Patescibacteria group bacterium]
MSDNGEEIKDRPSPEELAIAKRKKFEENPEEFFHFSEFVIAVRKVDNGLQTLIGRSNRTELEAAVTRVQYEATKLFDMIEIKKAQEQKKLVQPGGIMNFARKK